MLHDVPTPRHIPSRVSLGAPLNDVAAPGLLASHREHRGGAELARHEHGASYLCVVLEGGYAQRASDEIECGRGSLITHPAGHAHANRFGTHVTRCVNLYFDPVWLEDDAIRCLLADYRHLRIVPHSPLLTRLDRELATRDAGTKLAIATATLDLLGQVTRSQSRRAEPKWLASVREAISADISRTPALSVLGTIAGVHPAHLARSFQASTGESVGAFARRIRLDAADAMLATGNASIAEVATETGFYDQAHFARAYRRRYGLTPGQRRTQSRS